MQIDYQQIGQRIKKIRKEKHMTQEQLAERMSVSVGYISQLERGVTKISLDTLAEISTILNCEPSFFLSGVTPSQNAYLQLELASILKRLSPREKQILLEVAEVLASHAE